MDADFEMIDTHAHLYVSQFDEDRAMMMQRAFASGISKIFLPNIDSTSIEAMLDLESKYPDQCHAMMGLHPCSVNAEFQMEMRLMEDWLAKRHFCAIGETGTDRYWDMTFIGEQEACFKRQISLAKEMQLPIVIHSRESLDQNIEIVKEMQNGSLRGVFHCFTGTVEQANRIIDLGFYMGIGGVVTFRNSGLADVMSALPLTSFVLETDAPYLSPHPHRGKRNEPGYLRLIAEKLAMSQNKTVEEICRVTSQNAKQLFLV